MAAAVVVNPRNRSSTSEQMDAALFVCWFIYTFHYVLIWLFHERSVFWIIEASPGAASWIMQELICVDYYVVKLGMSFHVPVRGKGGGNEGSRRLRKRAASGKTELTQRGLESSVARIIFHSLTKAYTDTQNEYPQSTRDLERPL